MADIEFKIYTHRLCTEEALRTRKFRISESEHAKAFKRITAGIRDTFFYTDVDLLVAFAFKTCLPVKFALAACKHDYVSVSDCLITFQMLYATRSTNGFVRSAGEWRKIFAFI